MEDPVVTKIKKQFDQKGDPAKIPLMNGKQFFEARSEDDGIYVDNLKNQPFLPWKIFSEAINCLKENGGQVKKGNAINSRLGDSNLDLNTMEGYIASKVYDCEIGDTVFRRITPIASILAWAEICENTRGQICLLPGKEELQTFGNEKEVPLALNIEETKEDSEMASISATFDSRDIELKNLETKLAENPERIEELEKQLASRDEERGRLKEELNTKSEKISTLEKNLSDSKENARNLEGKLTNSKTELEKIEKLISEMEMKLSEFNQEAILKNDKITNFEDCLSKRDEAIKSLDDQLSQRDEAIKSFKNQLSLTEEAIESCELPRPA